MFLVVARGGSRHPGEGEDYCGCVSEFCMKRALVNEAVKESEAGRDEKAERRGSRNSHKEMINTALLLHRREERGGR